MVPASSNTGCLGDTAVDAQLQTTETLRKPWRNELTSGADNARREPSLRSISAQDPTRGRDANGKVVDRIIKRKHVLRRYNKERYLGEQMTAISDQ